MPKNSLFWVINGVFWIKNRALSHLVNVFHLFKVLRILQVHHVLETLHWKYWNIEFLFWQISHANMNSQLKKGHLRHPFWSQKEVCFRVFMNFENWAVTPYSEICDPAASTDTEATPILLRGLLVICPFDKNCDSTKNDFWLQISKFSGQIAHFRP